MNFRPLIKNIKLPFAFRASSIEFLEYVIKINVLTLKKVGPNVTHNNPLFIINVQ